MSLVFNYTCSLFQLWATDTEHSLISLVIVDRSTQHTVTILAIITGSCTITAQMLVTEVTSWFGLLILSAHRAGGTTLYFVVVVTASSVLISRHSTVWLWMYQSTVGIQEALSRHQTCPIIRFHLCISSSSVRHSIMTWSRVTVVGEMMVTVELL